jgi:hypothetical protein
MQLLLENLSPEDMKKYLKEYYNHAAKELKLSRAPRLFLDQDKKNADDLLGKTGYYDPDKEEIHLFITDRHAKDVIRSFAHELIHHDQKLSGFNDNLDLSKTAHDPAYASHDPKLREMERDAFERGNMMFRDWCDSKKMERKQTMSESKINAKKSDLNKDGKLSGYEKKRGSAIANAMSGKSKPKSMKENEQENLSEEDQVVEAIYNKVMEKLKLQEAPREDDEPVEFGDDEGELDFSDPSRYQMNKGKVKKAGMSDFGDSDETPEDGEGDMEEIPTGDDEAPAAAGADPMAQLRAEKMMDAIKSFLNNARKSLADGDNEEAIHNFLEGRKATARLVRFIQSNPHLKLKHKGADVDLSKIKERKLKKKKPMKENKEPVVPTVPYSQLFVKKERLMNDRFNTHETNIYEELMNRFIKKE